MSNDDILMLDMYEIKENALVSIKKAIDDDGRSHNRISEECGLSTAYLNHIYNYHKAPRLPTILKLCAVLGKSPNELLGWQ